MPKKPDTETQFDRFIETARRLGADENEAAFQAKLATIAKQKPKDVPPASDTLKKAQKPKR